VTPPHVRPIRPIRPRLVVVRRVVLILVVFCPSLAPFVVPTGSTIIRRVGHPIIVLEFHLHLVLNITVPRSEELPHQIAP
jgi:hypothetical protein